jgi:hypothetical protein
LVRSFDGEMNHAPKRYPFLSAFISLYQWLFPPTLFLRK